MGQRLIETAMGAVVLAVAALFLVFAWNTAGLRPVAGYTLKAGFASVGGLAPGSDVRIGGVKVGSVTGQRIDPDSYRAEIDFTVRDGLALPADTEASVTSDGLLGGKYLRLVPGTATQRLAPGDTLAKTRDALALEELLGRAIFLLAEPPRTDAPNGADGANGKEDVQ